MSLDSVNQKLTIRWFRPILKRINLIKTNKNNLKKEIKMHWRISMIINLKKTINLWSQKSSIRSRRKDKKGYKKVQQEISMSLQITRAMNWANQWFLKKIMHNLRLKLRKICRSLKWTRSMIVLQSMNKQLKTKNMRVGEKKMTSGFLVNLFQLLKVLMKMKGIFQVFSISIIMITIKNMDSILIIFSLSIKIQEPIQEFLRAIKILKWLPIWIKQIKSLKIWELMILKILVQIG